MSTSEVGPIMDDPLSDIFRLLKLKSCVYFVRDFCSPWGMRIDGGGFAQFHVVTRGECIVKVNGTCHQATSGDVILFPRGHSHVLSDRDGRDALPGAEVMQSFQTERPYFADGGKPTQLVCGHFEYRNELRHPVIEQLPAILHVRSFDTLSPDSVESVLPLLVREMRNDKPGGDVVVERLAEVLLIQTLRAHYQQQPQSKGFWAGLADRRLAPAIRLIHADTGAKVSLATLARSAGMSRSAFAQRFKERIGLSPIDYMTKWRMYRASELLRSEPLSLGQVAARIGYESEVSFSRAFKREFDVSPGAYRRRTRDDGGPAAP